LVNGRLKIDLSRESFSENSVIRDKSTTISSLTSSVVKSILEKYERLVVVIGGSEESHTDKKTRSHLKKGRR